jgi:diaminopimelate decarboxylase
MQRIVQVSPSDAIVNIARSLPTPSVAYDLDAISRTVAELRADLSVVPGTALSFAVKANRFPPVLAHLARLGAGADVASIAEFAAARRAGLHPVTATAPGLSPAELACLRAGGVLIDADNMTQLRDLAAATTGPVGHEPAGSPGTAIGLRVRVPISPADGAPDGHQDGTGVAWSRFGVDPADPELHALLRRHHLSVERLHVHAGELGSPARVRQLTEALVACLPVFPAVHTINLGGGLAALYADREAARQAWREVASALGSLRGPPRLVVEPGMLLTALAGYLVTTVRAADRHPSGHRLITVDASAWNLFGWSRPRPVARYPVRPGPPVPHLIAGPTCYEHDVLGRHVLDGPVEVGDRLVFNAAGAYVTSMARTMHDLPPPAEYAVGGDLPAPFAAARARNPVALPTGGVPL